MDGILGDRDRTLAEVAQSSCMWDKQVRIGSTRSYQQLTDLCDDFIQFGGFCMSERDQVSVDLSVLAWAWTTVMMKDARGDNTNKQ